MQDDWKKLIGGCFGSADKKFAGHPLDEERAVELLRECVKDRVSLQELLDETGCYLKVSLNFDNQPSNIKENIQNHIDGELQKVKEKFEDWLE